MKIVKPFLFTILPAFLYISSANSNEPAKIDNWIRFCPSPQLCFEHPASLKPANVQMIDSLAGQLNNENLTLYFDLGLYASNFSELTPASSKAIIVDGYEGTVLTFQNKIALTIEKISHNARFSMLLEFKDTIKSEEAIRIFKTVKFKL